MRIWAVWKPVKNPEKSKPDKLPMSYQVNPATGTVEIRAASCNDPNTWMTYDNAVKLLKSSKKYKGLQIALSPIPPKDGEDVLVAGDVDKAFNKDGTIDVDKLKEVMAIGSYAEFSPTVPSQDYDDGGLRFLCFGHFSTDAGKHNGDFEIYQNSKWITITGHKLIDAPANIVNAQAAIDFFRDKHFKAYYEIDNSDLPKTNIDFTDEQIISRLENSPNANIKDTFKHYFYKGHIDDTKKTEEDFNFCCLVRGWSQKSEQIDSIFRQSKLYRDKWDEIHYSNGDTYGERTIKNALGARTKDDWIYRLEIIQPIPKEIDWPSFNLTVGNFRIDCTGIYHIVMDKEGNEDETRISSTPCLITAKGINRDTDELVYKVLIKDGACKEKTVWRKGSGLLKKSGVLELMEFGLEFQESDYGLINEFFFRFINTYRTELPEEVVASSSGWKDGFTRFVIGNRVVTAKSIDNIVQIDNPAVKMHEHEGTADDWAAGTDDIMKYKPVRFKAYGAVGCLLLRIADIENYIFDQNCGTTRLKSFTHKLVSSMFGHPKRQQLSAKSTALGIEKIAAACNDLPIFLDETSENVAFVMELIYRFANSNTRVKSNVSSGLEMSDNYCSGLFLTGEDSIITESSKGGHHARRVPETHGVPEDKEGKPLFVSLDVKNKVTKAMNKNYGNIAPLFIQELIPLIPKLDEIYTENFKKLPDTGIDALKGRLKGYYAVILTAGQILEKVLAKLGMTPCDPLQIVKDYFVENVMSGVTEPDHIKILRIAYDMFVSDKAHFGATAGSEFVANEKLDMSEIYGWIDTKNGVTLVNIRQQALKSYVVKTLGDKDGVNRCETAIGQWNLQHISNHTESKEKDKKTGEVKTKIKNVVQIRTQNGDRQWVIQIPFANFYRYLNLEDEEGEKPPVNSGDNNPNSDDTENEPEVHEVPKIPVDENPYPDLKISANVPASSGDNLNLVSSASAYTREDIIVPGDNVDLYVLLMKEMGDGQ